MLAFFISLSLNRKDVCQWECRTHLYFSLSFLSLLHDTTHNDFFSCTSNFGYKVDSFLF